MSFHYINGDFQSAEDSKIHISDLGIQRGFSVFDYFLIEQGTPLFFEDYVSRFITSAKLISPKISAGKIKEVVAESVARNNIESGAIKLIYSGGYSANLYQPSEPNLMVFSLSTPTYPEKYYSEGVQLSLFNHQRNLPEIKTTNYFFPLSKLHNTQKANSLDVLYHKEGLVTESSRSNFFIVDKSGMILTASKNILKGITRKQILGFRSNFKIEEKEITIEEVLNAEEAFMTSSTKPIFPVVRIDDKVIGDGLVGKTTMALMKEFAIHKRKYLDSNKGILNN